MVAGVSGSEVFDYPEPDEFVRLVGEVGTIAAAARRLGRKPSTVRDWIERNGLSARVHAARKTYGLARGGGLPPEQPADPDVLGEDIRKAIAKKPKSVEELADKFDVPPKRIRAVLAELREQGYRIPEEEDASHISLQKVPPARTNLHRSLLEGDQLTVGLVSDTHLSSNEEALEELELAYDVFAERGITEVWHPGDWTCGRGIFRTQDAEIKNHTFETQVQYLVENYPHREGIVTRGITGNHDIEGDFGKLGANPLVAMANQRDDIEFLGDFSAWVELPNGAWAHLLHGRGGMSYSYSYKAQKLVDGYPGGRKPALLCVGHWHVHGTIEARSVQVVFPGCFEKASPFMERLGLAPAVGFHILHLTLGDDGSLVKFMPEWFRFYDGRRVTP